MRWPCLVHFAKHGYASVLHKKVASWTVRNLYYQVYGRHAELLPIEELLPLHAQGVYISSFIREPLSRSLAVYRHFRRKYAEWLAANRCSALDPPAWKWLHDYGQDATFHDFLSAIPGALSTDPHTQPQHGWWAEFIHAPIPLERSAEGWRRIQAYGIMPGIVLPRSNYTHGDTPLVDEAELTERDAALFRQLYEGDISWYERCNQTQLQITRSAASYLQ